VGLALLIAMQTVSEEEAVLGLIPAGIGLAYLIYYFVEGRKLEAKQREEEERAAERTYPDATL
jgi:hypothetical protein